MSTDEYLRLLRQGDFAPILDWLDTLSRQYSLPPKKYEADTIIPLMIFELVNHGLKPKELMQLPIIYAVTREKSIFLPGETEYGLTLLISALLQYQVYEDNKLISYYQTTSPMDIEEVKEWMARDNNILTSKQNSDALAQRIKVLTSNLSNYDKQVEKVKRKIISLSFYQDLCKNYWDFLKGIESLDDNLLERLELIKSLDKYLCSQFITTSQLTAKLAEYVCKLKALTPNAWEEIFLAKFLKKPLYRQLYDESIQASFFAFQRVRSWVPVFKGNDTEVEPAIDNSPSNK